MLGDKESLIPMFVLKCRERGRERESETERARERKGLHGIPQIFLISIFSLYISKSVLFPIPT
jgi:hypothetical protein